MKNVLELKNVTKRYDTFTLNDITLSIPGGTILGLIGENGAGKSTLIKCILGIVRPDEGEITALGTDVERAKADIGVVLDESLFHNQLKPVQVERVMAGLYPNWDKELFFSYLEKFNLPKDKLIKEFSRGMKMKLGIAIALSHHAKLLILDEATSGLDPVVRDEVVEMFSDFTRDENHSILISSHIVSDLEKLCDYIAFLHKGKLLLCEEKDQLLAEYGLIHCTADELQSLPSHAVRYKKENAYGVEAMVERNAVPSDIRVSPISIEELFVFMVKEAR